MDENQKTNLIEKMASTIGGDLLGSSGWDFDTTITSTIESDFPDHIEFFNKNRQKIIEAVGAYAEECNLCSWYYEPCELDEEGYCDECAEELNEEE